LDLEGQAHHRDEVQIAGGFHDMLQAGDSGIEQRLLMK
jgi:hypothetical protein